MKKLLLAAAMVGGLAVMAGCCESKANPCAPACPPVQCVQPAPCPTPVKCPPPPPAPVVQCAPAQVACPPGNNVVYYRAVR